MYLKDYPVPVPCDRKGIIIRNEKRVELESDRAYSTETKDTRVKRKTIGMLLPLFPEQMYPNENYFELVPENTVPADIRDAFLRRCERKKEIDRLKKDPAAMARRIADGIRSLKEKGREIAMAQGKEIDSLREKVAELEAQLANREFEFSRIGSIAEASLAVTDIFKEAEKAAAVYLENIRRRSEEK